jgi:hypothetical protein
LGQGDVIFGVSAMEIRAVYVECSIGLRRENVGYVNITRINLGQSKV